MIFFVLDNDTILVVVSFENIKFKSFNSLLFSNKLDIILKEFSLEKKIGGNFIKW